MTTPKSNRPDTRQNTNYQWGNVVAFTDPFKLGDDISRPLLIINNDVAPFVDEQHTAVARGAVVGPLAAT